MATRKTEQEIAHYSIPEGPEDIRRAAYLEMVALDELTEPPEPCSPFQCTPDGAAAIKMWNGGLEVLEAQRNLPTLALQTSYIASVIERAPYVLALVPSEDGWTFFWVKGFDKAVMFGGDEQAIIDEQAIALIMPNLGWAELLMTGHGDCEASMQHRAKAIWDDGQGAVQRACELVTLMATVSFCGPQPDMRDVIPPALSPDILSQAGEALFGTTRWRRRLGRLLGEHHPNGPRGSIDPRRVSEWAYGEVDIPEWVGPMLARLLRERAVTAALIASDIEER